MLLGGMIFYRDFDQKIMSKRLKVFPYVGSGFSQSGRVVMPRRHAPKRFPPSKLVSKRKAINLRASPKKRKDPPYFSVNKRPRYVAATVEPPSRPRISELLTAQASAGPVAAAAAAGAAAAIAAAQPAVSNPFLQRRPVLSPFYHHRLWKEQQEPWLFAFKVQRRRK